MITWSAHLSMLFAELPFAERPAAARRAGFRAVESWWPPSGAAPAWAREVRRHDLRVTSINCDSGVIEAGERGFLNVPERREQVLDDLARALELARSVGASFVNVPLGRALPGVRRSTQLRTATAVLGDCAALAEAAGLTILVEPLNEEDVPGYLVPDAPAAAAVIESVGSRSVRMLYDAYHAAKSGHDPPREVGAFVELVAHVQYAHAPGRDAPGADARDLWRLVDALAALGYEGAIGLEYDPGGSTAATLGFLGEAPPAAPFPSP